MKYKFENLDVWKLAIELLDLVYSVTEVLPEHEKFNLKSQLNRAGTSISLNIAEGSTTQSNAEQAKFTGYSIRSLIEVIACIRIIERRNYTINQTQMTELEQKADELFIKLQAFHKYLKS